MKVQATQFCNAWRQRIEAIDPLDADARLQLNTAYSELVEELRQIFQETQFNESNPPSDPQHAQRRAILARRCRIYVGDSRILEGTIRNSVLNALTAVYTDSRTALDIMKCNRWIRPKILEACFLDATPIADYLLAMSKTKLVENGVEVCNETLYPEDVYRRLARHCNSTPKSQVARCVYAPQDLLEELAQSTSNTIIYPLAANTMTPTQILVQLTNWNGWGRKTARGIVESNDAYIGGEAWQLLEIGRIITAVDQHKQDVLLAILKLIEVDQHVAEALHNILRSSSMSKVRRRCPQD
jgi:hypothetical protein